MIVQWNAPTVTLAAEHAGRPSAGGITTLVIGVVLLALGSPAVRAFRQILDRSDRTPESVLRFLRKIPPPGEETRPDRPPREWVVISAFAVVGLLSIPLGIYRIVTGRP
ncbi:hypothetical protein [Actinomadura sp. DC4]|uniref:hypothetical protein n=1 Tax=Actinomadura sp. DC4 TaxID=3055069 RepID=UPI0025AF2927|nr:hypothetical protein [Actinomadura sp. DC4]MDN3354227.1 hypothetical protein [Actinomadura sp. DC4]